MTLEADASDKQASLDNKCSTQNGSNVNTTRKRVVILVRSRAKMLEMKIQFRVWLEYFANK